MPTDVDNAQLRKSTEQQIDAFLRQVGYDDISQRTDEDGWRHVQLGSSEGRVGVRESDGTLFLHVEAIVMTLPADKELLLPLMRELLEINSAMVGPLRLGIRNKYVFALSAWPATDLQEGQVAATINFTMKVADQLDDELIGKYGGTSKRRTSSVKVTA